MSQCYYEPERSGGEESLNVTALNKFYKKHSLKESTANLPGISFVVSVICSPMKGTATDYILEQNLDFGGLMFGLLWDRRLIPGD